MTSPATDNSLYTVRVVCDILGALKGHDLDCTNRLTIRLRPKDTDIVMWVPFFGMDEEAYRYEGQCIPVYLSATHSFLEKTSARNFSVTTLDGHPLDERAQSQSFSAVGQYMGFNGTDALVQSTFLLLVSIDGDFSPAIGDWVKVSGEMSVFYNV